MSEAKTVKTTVIPNPQGLHARPSSALVKTASAFSASISIRNLNNGTEADAKFLLEVMTLAAAQGSKIEVVAEGDDAEEAVDAIVALIDSGFGES